MKRAVAYIGSAARQFQDFIWYYLAYGKKYEWDLIFQPMVRDSKLEEYFRKSGLFRNIYVIDTFFHQSTLALGRIGMEMFLYWIVGQNKRYAKREVKKIIDISKYERICLTTTGGVLGGLMVLCSDHIPIDLLEDGLGDNPNPYERFNFHRLTEKRYLIAYIFAKMGYFNFLEIFPLKSTKKCIRYSINPETIFNALYKEVRRLNDMTLVDQDEYTDLIKITFGIKQIRTNFDVVLFSTPLTDLTQNYGYYNKQALVYLKEQGYHKVLLKKHPRDVSDYRCDGLEIIEVDSNMPGENLLEIVKGNKLFFMAPSTIIRAIDDRLTDVCIFKYTNLKTSSYLSGFERGMLELKKDNNIDHIQVISI